MEASLERAVCHEGRGEGVHGVKRGNFVDVCKYSKLKEAGRNNVGDEPPTKKTLPCVKIAYTVY